MLRVREMLARWFPLSTRRFDAAAGGRRGQGVQTFAGINAEGGAGAGPGRGRAGYCARHQPWIGNAVQAIVAITVGAGITPQSQHGDSAVRAALHGAWGRWVVDADADGVTDLYGLQALVVRTLVEQGECFAHLL